MIVELTQFGKLSEKFKEVLGCDLDPERMVFVVKDVNGTPKTITTSIINALKKGKVESRQSSDTQL